MPPCGCGAEAPHPQSSSRTDRTLTERFQSRPRATCIALVVGSWVEVLPRPNELRQSGEPSIWSLPMPAASEAAIRHRDEAEQSRASDNFRGAESASGRRNRNQGRAPEYGVQHCPRARPRQRAALRAWRQRADRAVCRLGDAQLAPVSAWLHRPIDIIRNVRPRLGLALGSRELGD